MSEIARDARRAAAPVEEDPNATVACSSPPCFMHELDPSYLGYLHREEVITLLDAVLAAEWGGATPDEAPLRAVLARHLQALGAVSCGRAVSGGPGRLARAVRDALPRLHDHVLRRDLETVLGALERGLPDRDRVPGENSPMQGWDEVRRWRKARRAELTAKRLAVSQNDRAQWNGLITALIEQTLPAPGSMRIGFYWPFKGEYDPRALARSLRDRGARLALPVVVERAKPLAFREWWPGMRMASGVWNIPVPAEGDWILPDVLLAPLLGFDGSGYRLGYGGGYYDRAPAAMPAKPRAIGIGYELSRLATIHPQPHDVPMDLIVTERGAVRTAGGVPTGTDASAASETPGLRREGGGR